MASCRICYEEAERAERADEAANTNPLLEPCECKGSVQYVHKRCLNRWLRTSGERRCELCNTTYLIQELALEPIHRPPAYLLPLSTRPYWLFVVFLLLYFGHVYHQEKPSLLPTAFWRTAEPWTVASIVFSTWPLSTGLLIGLYGPLIVPAACLYLAILMYALLQGAAVQTFPGWIRSELYATSLATMNGIPWILGLLFVLQGVVMVPAIYVVRDKVRYLRYVLCRTYPEFRLSPRAHLILFLCGFGVSIVYGMFGVSTCVFIMAHFYRVHCVIVEYMNRDTLIEFMGGEGEGEEVEEEEEEEEEEDQAEEVEEEELEEMAEVVA